jgi:hypothetical protein
MNFVKNEEIENRIITIRGEKVLIDGDVAEVYGVETKRVNEAVKNNRDKFPGDYLTELSQDEKNELVENFDRFNRLKHSTGPAQSFHGERPLHAGHDSQKQISHTNNVCHYRDFRADSSPYPHPESVD